MPSSLVVDNARQLAAVGHHAGVVEYLASQQGSELEESPTLALLYGTAQARLGRHREGLLWVEVALDRARERNEPVVERHALNARGAIAFVSGRIDEAADYFTQGLLVASRDGDVVAIARCSNNLGAVSHLRGRSAEAIGSWQVAVAAFERASLRQGVAECRHNLAIAYREQGALDRALVEADRAVADAEAAGDAMLWALALRGRAEIRILRGELERAVAELERVREVRKRLPAPVEEAEDRRVEAAVLFARGQCAPAERVLRAVIARAVSHQAPHLQAEAMRDLTRVLCRAGRGAEAQAVARQAKVLFAELGAEREVRNLAEQGWDEAFAAELRQSLEPLDAAQELADAGRYAELVAYLGERSQDTLEQSPLLALLLGIGLGRLGRLAAGQQWAQVALARARALRDRVLQARALNVCGVIALERGGIVEATQFFTQAQDEAMQDNDLVAVGRCANNLGAIASLRGDYGGAVGAHTRSLAAFERAGEARGIVEARHNLAIAYRQQGDLDAALRAADGAVAGAEQLGDGSLQAQALAGRAEIRVARGDAELAIREAASAMAMHRELKDTVLELEDERIVALAMGLAGRVADAADLLCEVIARASEHRRPLLVAMARRDLACLLTRGAGDVAAAAEVAETARATLERLGARGEVERLDAFLAGLRQ
jgi:tetratricopeptide (TPR) repeat protein